MNTRDDQRHAADIWREHGRRAATGLVGGNGIGTTFIGIMALGDHVMRARTIGRNAEPAAYRQDRFRRSSDRDRHEAA